MDLDIDILRSVFKFVTKETEDICRFCFISTKTDAVFLDDYVLLETKYLDETINFQDMLNTLNVQFEDDLPCTLCSKCAESIRKSYLFHKLCNYSNSQWNKCLNNIAKTMNLSDNLSSRTKTAYSISNANNELVFFQKKQIFKSKKIVLAVVKQFEEQRRSMINRRNLENKTPPREACIVDDHYVMPVAESHQKPKGERKQQTTNTEYRCSYCSKEFNSQIKFKGHFDRLHAAKTIMCSKCPAMFSTDKLVRWHEYTYHEPLECKKCCLTFPSRKQLWYHVQKHESIECKTCNKIFRNKNYYNVHLKICGEDISNRYKFICDICDKPYVNRKGIQNHLITTHGFGVAVKCPWCDKKFPSNCHLGSHIVKHTRQRDFSCKICGAVFVTGHALKYHIRLHTGEKPFSCDICGETFISASRKMDHVRRKHLHIMKQCPICHKEYSETYLSRHQRRHQDPKSSFYVSEGSNILK